ncbi:MAG: primosomal protein N' [Flavicella sp.]|nr:primosomal protein N' [Flavicella sp.]
MFNRPSKNPNSLIPFESFFINVILPIPLQRLFTYRITEAEAQFLKKGMRVAVPFGKKKIYTALVFEIHQEAPVAYEAKPIHQILDDIPVVNELQLQHWEWIASYYMSSLGEVYRAALPSAFLLESETIVLKNPAFSNQELLTDEEFLVFEALQQQAQLSVLEIHGILSKKNVFPLLNTLIGKEAIFLKEEIYEQYKPKWVKYIRLNEGYRAAEAMQNVLEQVSKAKKQHQALLSYFSLEAQTGKPIQAKTLQEVAQVSAAILKSLVDKGILEFYEIQTDRIHFDKATEGLHSLNAFQERAFQEIKSAFQHKAVTLLHGVTSSGKTAVYAHLIQEQLALGKQVLFLLPEIALTTQIIQRLQTYFGGKISVFHSKYSMNERVEVWNNVLHAKPKAQIVLGARSSLFLPFSNLGLVIVDEEHETSYKQFDPAPRYHARDAAILLAQLHQAKTLLGSATPSLESTYNAEQSKYGLVNLDRRYGEVQLPEIALVDIKEKHRKKRMKGHFSDVLIAQITEAVENKEQVILFQNRRGYSPVVECETCAVSPQCPNCDVSLTFHKHRKELRCHYCNYRQAMPLHCGACGSEKLSTLGFGTEQIELELHTLFPEAKVGRMDLDTTRGKYGYQKIIGAFQAQEIDILVGTQMLSKGLDFGNVTLVGVMNADTLLNFPDFRSHERTYQMLVQVAGRSGRSKKRGKVLIQTFNPYHQILQQVTTNDYKAMYKEQLEDRWQFHYPPYYRVLRITLRHRDLIRLEAATEWFATSLRNAFHDNVLGPNTPNVSRVRNLYIKHLLLKIPPNQSLVSTKKHLEKIKSTFEAIGNYRSVRLGIDVDAY